MNFSPLLTAKPPIDRSGGTDWPLQPTLYSPVGRYLTAKRTDAVAATIEGRLTSKGARGRSLRFTTPQPAALPQTGLMLLELRAPQFDVQYDALAPGSGACERNTPHSLAFICRSGLGMKNAGVHLTSEVPSLPAASAEHCSCPTLPPGAASPQAGSDLHLWCLSVDTNFYRSTPTPHLTTNLPMPREFPAQLSRS